MPDEFLGLRGAVPAGLEAKETFSAVGFSPPRYRGLKPAPPRHVDPPENPTRQLQAVSNYWHMAEYRRRLPHFHREHAHLFVTWRLDGSLPAPVPDIVYATPGHRFVAQDRALAHAPGPQWLADTKVAALVAETLRSGEREMNLYELHAWTIMPNHVHILVLPGADPIKIMRWIKGRSAREANMVLARTGRFWQEESYDHWVRNRKEFCRIAHYIDENPVSAGFVNRAEEWPFSSARDSAG